MTPITISRYAFYRCKRLKEFKIIRREYRKGCQPIIIEEGAFRECTSLEFFDFRNVAFSKDSFALCKSLKEIDLTEALCGSIKSNEGKESNGLIIPENAFMGCSSLRKVILPKELIKIEKHAFSQCDNLEEVYFEGSFETLKKITDVDAFYSFKRKRKINFVCKR